MEDYEKKYKEALSRAKSFELPEYKNIAESIFPELQESKDEKIRNALIRFHKSTIDVDGIKGDDIIAWLEKQGSQQPTIIWHSVSEEPEEMKELFCEWESDDATWHDVAFYDEESKTFRHAKMPINVTKWVYVDELLERQGEQKPTFDTRYEVKIGDGIGGTYNTPFDYEHATITQKDFAPKPTEWSDEDENYLQSAENACEYQYGKNTSTILWLKSLKDRMKGKED